MFRLLDPAAFEGCFARYVAALTGRIEGVVAVDGKTMRRSFDRQQDQGPLHLISAFACDTRLALGQCKGEDQLNEIIALPELLALLTLDGCIVTADAMHCQKVTARAIVERDGDYALAVKDNQKTPLGDIQLLLDDPEAVPDDTAQTVDGDHGRIETRRAQSATTRTGSPSATASLGWLPWAGREPPALGRRRRHGRGPVTRPQEQRT